MITEPRTEIENHLMQAAGIMRNSVNTDKGLEECNRAILFFQDIKMELLQPVIDFSQIQEEPEDLFLLD